MKWPSQSTKLINVSHVSKPSPPKCMSDPWWSSTNVLIHVPHEENAKLTTWNHISYIPTFLMSLSVTVL